MTKKSGIIFHVFLLVLVFLANNNIASAAALTYSNDTTISLTGSSINLTIQAGSTATSIVVGTTTLTVTVSTSETLTLVSLDRYTLTNDLNLTQTCTSSQNSVTVTGPQTVVFTPTTSTCTGSSSSTTTTTHGSSGRRAVPGYTTPITTPASKTNETIQKYKYNFGNKTLKKGSQGEYVKELQKFLNNRLNLGLVVDGKLGPKTISVIKKWQKDHGLVVDGLVGPKTKAKMNAEALLIK